MAELDSDLKSVHKILLDDYESPAATLVHLKNIQYQVMECAYELVYSVQCYPISDKAIKLNKHYIQRFLDTFENGITDSCDPDNMLQSPAAYHQWEENIHELKCYLEYGTIDSEQWETYCKKNKLEKFRC